MAKRIDFITELTHTRYRQAYFAAVDQYLADTIANLEDLQQALQPRPRVNLRVVPPVQPAVPQISPSHELGADSPAAKRIQDIRRRIAAS